MTRMYVFLAFLLCLPLSAAPTQWWSQGDPTPDAQNALEWLNRARADPTGTLAGLISAAATDSTLAACLAARQPQTPAQLLTQLQSAVTIAAATSAAYPQSAAIDQGPLVFYPAFLQRAAALTTANILPSPVYLPGQSAPTDFPPIPTASTLYSGAGATFSGPSATGGIADFGPVGANYAESTLANLYDASLGPREWILSWLCSPGTGSPPPNFLLQGDALPNLTLAHTRMAGISLLPAASGGRSLSFFRAGSEFFTASDLPYGAAGTVFITGVVYRDQNQNGRYDPGEGIAGVTVTLDRAGWGAISASAGGYAIPVPANSGTYTVTASGGPFGTVSATTTVAGDSVKLDWIAPPLAVVLPAQVPVPPPSGPGRLLNLSTRGQIEAGADALIGGFVVSGPPGATETVLVRGVGPSLATVGIPAAECVPATQLQLWAGSTILAANSGWTTAPDGGVAVRLAAAQTGAFPLMNWTGGGGDSAIVATLPPGAYSAVVTPPAGTPAFYTTSHLGLVEIYEISSTAGAALINLSSRGLTGSAEGRLVIGATAGGAGNLRLLVRAAGPALAQTFGLSPVLADPALTLYDQSGATVATNDDWSFSPQTDQIRALGLTVGAFPFPEGSADSALLITLPAGQYSAQLSAQTGTAATGLALVEIYSAP